METGASLVITLHYSKGNKANTQTGERSRGSSVVMGDVDAAIEFVAQQDADESNNILAVEAVLPKFPPVKPFCVQWDLRDRLPQRREHAWTAETGLVQFRKSLVLILKLWLGLALRYKNRLQQSSDSL